MLPHLGCEINKRQKDRKGNDIFWQTIIVSLDQSRIAISPEHILLNPQIALHQFL